jgi:hypothetical protein
MGDGAPGLIALRSIAPLQSFLAVFAGFAACECHGRGAMEQSAISPGAPSITAFARHTAFASRQLVTPLPRERSTII